MPRSSTAVIVAVTLGLTFFACASRQTVKDRKPDDLDRKYSTFAYIEQGKLVTFIVDTHAARYRDKTDYMPVEIAIANNGLRTLVVSRESFTLVDEQGNRYPAATPRELMEGYDFLDLDRDELSQLALLTDAKFGAYNRYSSRFSPTRSSLGDLNPAVSTVVRDVVYLPKFGYLIDYIYFPRPATGIKDHRFELFLESESLENPVFVKFEVK